MLFQRDGAEAAAPQQTQRLQLLHLDLFGRLFAHTVLGAAAATVSAVRVVKPRLTLLEIVV